MNSQPTGLETAEQARGLTDIARENGVITLVGHAFPLNPVYDLAAEIIEAGEIGEITMFKACQHVDVYGEETVLTGAEDLGDTTNPDGPNILFRFANDARCGERCALGQSICFD